MRKKPNPWLLVSLGNPLRSDDGVGPFLLQRLRQQLGHSVEYLESGGDILHLLARWKDRWVCLVDAMISDRHTVGEVISLDGLQDPLSPSLCSTSSHGFGLAEAITMGKLIDSLPIRLDIFAINSENLAKGEKLSPTVVKAALQAEQLIIAHLSAVSGGPQCTSRA
ncbi:hydrogenase maturation protease [Microbulbifer sp. OS29]|uniref:Hydrogenase maturation protease n=1 Tax=Microbulbifer okhotskensis TaxID=2926617 RepID=A0A9X2EV63_9GAMM|nr:hydrogenase maturation protease [Microbulbifer okhotskensis]MCO1336108.1 hydrogenase maturation protease [Microbulbifer okhotskensis]